jgi:hypothetical protein
MRSLFNKHPRSNGFSGYFEHARSALGTSGRLMMSTFFFLIHGILPFVPVPKYLNLESTINYLKKSNEKIN